MCFGHLRFICGKWASQALPSPGIKASAPPCLAELHRWHFQRFWSQHMALIMLRERRISRCLSMPRSNLSISFNLILAHPYFLGEHFPSSQRKCKDCQWAGKTNVAAIIRVHYVQFCKHFKPLLRWQWKNSWQAWIISIWWDDINYGKYANMCSTSSLFSLFTLSLHSSVFREANCNRFRGWWGVAQRSHTGGGKYSTVVLDWTMLNPVWMW